MFDRERTLLEVLTRQEPGTAEWAGELIRDHRRGLDRARLSQYAARLGVKKQLAQVSSAGPTRARTLTAS